MIVLRAYDRTWPEAFDSEAARLRSAFGNLFVDLQHIGSTAVPGLSAKPVIDMLAVVPQVEALDLQRDVWEGLGYEVMGEFGIPGRRYFRKDDAVGRRSHQVHAFAAGSREITRHLDFPTTSARVRPWPRRTGRSNGGWRRSVPVTCAAIVKERRTSFATLNVAPLIGNVE